MKLKKKLQHVISYLIVLCMLCGMVGGYVPSKIVQAKESTNSYIVTLNGHSGGSHFWMYNEQASDGPITLSYTVQELSSDNIGRNGVVANQTTSPQKDWPCDYGSAYRTSKDAGTNMHTNHFMKVGCTYTLTIGKDANGAVTFTGSYQNADGTTHELTPISDWADWSQSGPIGPTNKSYKHFGVHFTSSVTGTLTNVTCVDASGNDLGITSNQTGDYAIGVEKTPEKVAPPSYTVTLNGKNSDRHFLMSNKIPSSGPITLSYTVKELSTENIGRNGVVATLNSSEAWPCDYGSGYRTYKDASTNAHMNHFMKVGCTYTLTMGLDANGAITFTGGYMDGEGTYHPLDNPISSWADWSQSGPIGPTNKSYKYFGIHSTASFTGTLTNVTCVDADGKDLGITSNQSGSYAVGVEIEVEKAEPQSYTVALNGKSSDGHYLLSNKTPYSGPITLSYTVKELSTENIGRNGVVATLNSSETWPCDYGSGYRTYKDATSGKHANQFMKVGCTYTLTMGLDANGAITFTGGYMDGEGKYHPLDNPISSWADWSQSGPIGPTNKSYKHFGIHSTASFTGTLTNVTCVDADGNDLGITSNQSGSYAIDVSETPIPLDEGNYQRFTLLDTGAEDRTDGNIEGSLGLEKWDKVLFSANLKLGADSFFVYGAPWEQGRVTAYKGMQFYVSGNSVKLKFNGISGYTIYSIPNATVDEVFNLKITTDYVDVDKEGTINDIQLGVWINGELNQNRYIYLPDYVQHMNSGFVFIVQQESGAIASDILLSDVSYKLEGAGYLLTTTGSVVVTRNGQDYTVVGNVLTEEGQYHIVKTEGYRTITQNIFLYNGTDSDVPAVTYDYLGGDEVMPIAGYFGPYQMNDGTNTYNYVTSDIYKKIADSGINLINQSRNDYIGNQNVVLEQLRLAEKYNLGMYVSDLKLSNVNENIYSEYENMTDVADLAKRLGEYSSYDSFLGIHLWDEPYTDDYNLFSNAIFTQEDKYQRKLDSYLGIASSLNGYVNVDAFLNLMPLSSPNNTINGTVTDKAEIEAAYDAYLDKAIEQGNLKYLSYDNYLFSNAESSVDKATRYFKNLSIISEKAEEKQIPFWSYVQLGGDFDKRENERKYATTDTAALPTEAETYWQINMPLAFGAKGIEYFTLIQPDYFSYDDEKGVDCEADCCNVTGDCGHSHDYNRCGLIGANGEPTTYYPYVQKANAQIQAIDEVLMKSISKGVLAVGANAEANTSGLDSMISVQEVRSLKAVELSDDNNQGAIIGCFDYQNTEAFYAVNYDVENVQTMTMKFADNCVYRYVVDGVEYSGNGSQLAVEVGAGEAVLVVVDGVCGDANADGVVSVADIVRYKKVIAKIEDIVFDGGYIELTGDDKVDLDDIAHLRTYLVNR